MTEPPSWTPAEPRLILDTVAHPRRIIYFGSVVALCGWLWACSEVDPEPHIALLKSLQPEVREKAAGKLVLYGEAVVPRLIDESKSDYTRVRFEIARILGRIRDPRAVPAMVRMLDDSSYNVAAYAAWGLGEMKSPEAVPTLLRFTNSPAKVFRQQVVWALGRCYDDTVHAALADSVRHVVERALHDPTPTVRIAALQSARELGYPHMTDQLIRMAKDPSADVRHVAVQALGQAAVGDTPRPGPKLTDDEQQRTIETLVATLDEPIQTIRTKAVRALEKLGPPPEARSVLIRMLAKGTVEDQREARRVLEALQGQSARYNEDARDV